MRQVYASGKWYLPEEKGEDDDPFKNVPTEELRRRAIEQEAVKESERALHERQEEVRRFIAETPAYVNSDRNAGLIEGRLRSILAGRREVWPMWTREDLYRAADELHAEGALQVSGEYKRKGPTESEMYEMPLHQLRQRERGDNDRLGPLDRWMSEGN
jgi:hypothetical protein